MKASITSLFMLMAMGQVIAGNVDIPVTYNNAQVLPKNIRNFTYMGVYVEPGKKFGNNGRTESLGQGFNRSITFRDMIDGEKDAVKKGQLAGYLAGKGYGYDEAIGNTTGLVNASVYAHAPVLALGVTKKFTIAIVVPYKDIQVDVDSSAIASDRLNALADKLEKEGKGDDANKLRSQYMNAINKKLTDNGYQELQGFEKKSLGDIKVIGKYQLTNKKDFAMALIPSLTLPTGETKDINKIVDIEGGDGQLDIGLAWSTDYYLNRDFTLNTTLSYTNQLSDHQALRVAEKSDSTISPDIDPRVKRDLGDLYALSFGGSYSMFEGFKLLGAYTLSYKERDKYEGAMFDSERYKWMSINSEQNMQTVQAGFGYDTISLYRRKKFPIPMGTQLNMTNILSGKNVVKDTMTSLNISLFF
jgi:hypothetical protein